MDLRQFRNKQKTKPQPYRFPQDYPVPVEFTALDTAQFVVEHSNPDDWTRVAVCTYPQCYGCERAVQTRGWSDWAPRLRMYLEAKIYGSREVISQSLSASQLVPKLEDWHLRYGTICGRIFTVTRTGNGRRTKYLLEVQSETVAIEPTLTLTAYINQIPYETQQHFYKENR